MDKWVSSNALQSECVYHKYYWCNYSPTINNSYAPCEHQRNFWGPKGSAPRKCFPELIKRLVWDIQAIILHLWLPSHFWTVVWSVTMPEYEWNWARPHPFSLNSGTPLNGQMNSLWQNNLSIKATYITAKMLFPNGGRYREVHCTHKLYSDSGSLYNYRACTLTSLNELYMHSLQECVITSFGSYQRRSTLLHAILLVDQVTSTAQL